MDAGLSDLEALALRCHSDQAQTYINEAIGCYKAGAYRAAIVSTWIAVVFDLIDKIRELAMSGDKAAQQLEVVHQNCMTQIDRNDPNGIPNAQKFERNILDVCHNKLDFFDAQQLRDLQRLKEDRHRCAHPSFQALGVPYLPSAEHARLHIRNAISELLAQPPVQGRAAIAALRTTVESAYFPTDLEDACMQLRHSLLRNAKPVLVNSFVDLLLFDFLTQGKPLYLAPRAIAALNATFELCPVEFEARFATQINKAVSNALDQDLAGILQLVTHVTVAWSALSDPSKNKITNFVANGPEADVLSELGLLSRVSELESVVADRVSRLDAKAMKLAVSFPGLVEQKKNRALDLLADSESWGDTNFLFTWAIMPLFDSLDGGDVSRIIKMPKETGADLINSNSYTRFVRHVRQTAILPPNELDGLLEDNYAGYLIEDDT